MKKKRITQWGLLGLGAQGERLARSLKEAHLALIGVASSDAKRAQEFAQRFGARADTWRGLLNDTTIDVIGIATRNAQHARQAVDALRAGKHVFCEKPLALTLADGMAVKDATRKEGKQCAIGFQLRMHPAIQEIRKRISRGELGDLRFIEMHWSIGSWNQKKLPVLGAHQKWREDFTQSGGGALMARGVHLFDALRFITGLEVSEVRAYEDARIDRTTVGIVLLNKKIPATLMTSKILPGEANHIHVFGARGCITLRGDFSGKNEMVLEMQVESGNTQSRFSGADLYSIGFSECTLLFAGRPTVCANVDDGIAAIKIAEAWKKSARSGKSILVR